ncbi:MAG: SpoIIE family protein phosphatase [Melioribacteraceae bacterium]|nr:SpoIIE family protein phosphatase [Melioribacteraceae bacterium]
MPIGAMKNSKYEIYENEVAAGDTILMLSDGFPELQNTDNEMYGYERLKSIFKQNGNKISKEIITVLENESKTWSGEREQDDDITFVIIKVK